MTDAEPKSSQLPTSPTAVPVETITQQQLAGAEAMCAHLGLALEPMMPAAPPVATPEPV